MEAEESMELRDLPVDTRNYTIIDNITGKPIDQNQYSLSIDPEVIGKLNKLKQINEEKVRQASLKGQYGDEALVDTFTPEDNSVFTPVYEGEYIEATDYNTSKPVETPTGYLKAEEVEKVEEEKPEGFSPTEVVQSEGLLDRVVARDPSLAGIEKEAENEDENTQAQGIDAEGNPVQTKPIDNSIFTPEKTGLEEASKQIVKIDAKKIGPAIKPPKHGKDGNPRKYRIELDKMEIRQAKAYAWLAYILFFIPLLINKKNRFARIHVNEGLELNIIEILGVIFLLPYFLVTNATGILATVFMILALFGLVLLGLCALTIIPMMICAMCGLQFQTPWLWKKRIIKVAETRE